MGAFTPPEDKWPKVCPKWRSTPNQMWFFNLSPEANIHYIRFKLFAENLKQFWINREFVLNTYLENTKDRVVCHYNPSPEDTKLDKKTKDYLTLEFECEQELGNDTNFYNKIVVNFLYSTTKLWNTTGISSIGVCDIRVYTFDNTCGQPDYPLQAQVRRSLLVEQAAIEQYEFVCNDKEHTLEGKLH